MQKPAVQLAFPSLKAAAESKEIEGVSKETSFQVDPRLIEVEPGFNRPISPEHVAQLKQSKKDGATFPPIYVRVENGRIILVDGEHRWRAVMELIAEGVEILSMAAIQFRGSDAERYSLQITTSQGLGMPDPVAGTRYAKLIEFGWDEERIAVRIGKPVSHVKRCLALVEANTDVQQAVTRGEIATTTALALVKQHGSKAGQVIAKKTAENKAAGRKRVTMSDVQAKPKLSDVLALLREMPAEIEGEWAGRVRAMVAAKGGAA